MTSLGPRNDSDPLDHPEADDRVVKGFEAEAETFFPTLARLQMAVACGIKNSEGIRALLEFLLTDCPLRMNRLAMDVASLPTMAADEPQRKVIEAAFSVPLLGECLKFAAVIGCRFELPQAEWADMASEAAMKVYCRLQPGKGPLSFTIYTDVQKYLNVTTERVALTLGAKFARRLSWTSLSGLEEVPSVEFRAVAPLLRPTRAPRPSATRPAAQRSVQLS